MSIELALFKLSDILQIPLTYDRGRVSGELSGKLPAISGLNIPFTVKAVKLFYQEKCGVLASVMGDLSLLVTYNPKTGMASAYLIDNTKTQVAGAKSMPEVCFSSKMDLHEVIAALRSGIVKAFYYKEGWQVLKF